MTRVITIYECTECGARDRDLGRLPDPPKNLICWKCRSGRVINGAAASQEEAIMYGQGMNVLKRIDGDTGVEITD